jgi:hypothetical protein
MSCPQRDTEKEWAALAQFFGGITALSPISTMFPQVHSPVSELPIPALHFLLTRDSIPPDFVAATQVAYFLNIIPEAEMERLGEFEETAANFALGGEKFSLPAVKLLVTPKICDWAAGIIQQLAIIWLHAVRMIRNCVDFHAFVRCLWSALNPILGETSKGQRLTFSAMVAHIPAYMHRFEAQYLDGYISGSSFPIDAESISIIAIGPRAWYTEFRGDGLRSKIGYTVYDERLLTPRGRERLGIMHQNIREAKEVLKLLSDPQEEGTFMTGDCYEQRLTEFMHLLKYFMVHLFNGAPATTINLHFPTNPKFDNVLQQLLIRYFRLLRSPGVEVANMYFVLDACRFDIRSFLINYGVANSMGVFNWVFRHQRGVIPWLCGWMAPHPFCTWTLRPETFSVECEPLVHFLRPDILKGDVCEIAYVEKILQPVHVQFAYTLYIEAITTVCIILDLAESEDFGAVYGELASCFRSITDKRAAVWPFIEECARGENGVSWFYVSPEHPHRLACPLTHPLILDNPPAIIGDVTLIDANGHGFPAVSDSIREHWRNMVLANRFPCYGYYFTELMRMCELSGHHYSPEEQNLMHIAIIDLLLYLGLSTGPMHRMQLEGVRYSWRPMTIQELMAIDNMFFTHILSLGFKEKTLLDPEDDHSSDDEEDQGGTFPPGDSTKPDSVTGEIVEAAVPNAVWGEVPAFPPQLEERGF